MALSLLLGLLPIVAPIPWCDFEQPVTLSRGGEGVQPESEVLVVHERAHSGTGAAAVRYAFVADPPGLQYVGFAAPLVIPTRVDRFTTWVLGDNSGFAVNVRLVDASGETHQFGLGRLTFVGWQKLTTRITDGGLYWGGDGNGRLDPPLRLGLLLVDAGKRAGRGEVLFDDLSYDPEETVDPSWAVPVQPPAPVRLEGENVRPDSRLTEADGGWELHYRFEGGAPREWLALRLDAPLPRSSEVAAWVEGDGSGHLLRVRLRDAGGEVHQLTFGPILWHGWRRCAVIVQPGEHWAGDGNGQLDGDLTWESLVVDHAAAPSAGIVRFRGLTAVPAHGQARALRLLVAGRDSAAPSLGGAAVHERSALTRDTETFHTAPSSWRLDYTFVERTGLQYLEIPTPLPLGTTPGRLTLQVKGDGSGNPVRLRVVEQSGEWHQYSLGVLDFTDWRELSCEFGEDQGHWGGDGNGRLDGNLTLSSVLLDSAKRPSAGSVWFDDIAIEATVRAAEVVTPRIEPSAPGGIYGLDDPIAFELDWLDRRADSEDQGGVTVQAAVRDARGETLARYDHVVDPGAPEPWTLSIGPEAAAPGFYSLTLVWRVADDFDTRDISFCRLPEVGETDLETNPFGACLHYAQRKGRVPLNYELLRRAGGRWARDEYAWGLVEPQRGVYQFPDYNDRYFREAMAHGVRPLMILDYGNPNYDDGNAPTSDEAQSAFAEYAYQMVSRYKDVCKHWEVYNEPNIGFWRPKPDAVAYTRLLKLTYAAIKRADPDATVVGICTAGTDLAYIETVLKEGGGQFMDALSVHPYRYPRSPEESGFVDELQRLHELMDRYGIGDMPVWITEIGWPNHVAPNGSSEEHSANCLVRMVCLARALPFMGPIIWYDFQNDGLNPGYNEDNFGLVRLDFSPKRPYVAAAMMARAIAAKRFVRTLDLAPPIYGQEYAAGAERTLVLWSTPAESEVWFELDAPEVEVSDITGRIDRRPLADGRLRLTLGEAPVFVTGGFATGKVIPSELTATASEQVVYPGAETALTVRVGNPTRLPERIALSVALPDGWSTEAVAVDVAPGTVAEGRLTVRVPASATPGAYPLTITAGERHAEATVQVAAPIDTRLLPRLEGQAVRLAARCVNLTAGPVAGVTLRTDDHETALGDLAAGESKIIDLPTELSAPTERSRLVRATTGWRGGGMTMQHDVAAWICPRLPSCRPDGRLDEWASVDPVALTDWQTPVDLRPDGRDDLSAAARFGWTPEAICAAVTVTDDRHEPSPTAWDAWHYDSVQIALDPRHDERLDNARDYLELALCLGPTGAAGWSYFPEPGPLPEGRFAVRRNGHTTVYELALPWPALGLAGPPPTSRLGVDALVNENDGGGREGWLQAYTGTGWTKQPLRFGTLLLG